jgi:hypothetical protein
MSRISVRPNVSDRGDNTALNGSGLCISGIKPRWRVRSKLLPSAHANSHGGLELGKANVSSIVRPQEMARMILSAVPMPEGHDVQGSVLLLFLLLCKGVTHSRAETADE